MQVHSRFAAARFIAYSVSGFGLHPKRRCSGFDWDIGFSDFKSRMSRLRKSRSTLQRQRAGGDRNSHYPAPLHLPPRFRFSARSPARVSSLTMGEQTMPPGPRNRFVLRRESGHPGYSNAVILGTTADLKKLSEEVRSLAERGQGRCDHYVTEERRPNSRGAVAFEIITEDELRRLQEGDIKHRIWEAVGPFILITTLVLTVYGGYSLLQRVVTWLTS